MAKRVSISQKRREAPEWIFPWRPLGESPLPKWSATLLAAGAFVFLVASIRIRVTAPTPWAARKATLIHVAEDAAGRALTQQAREGGPFPSRFDPADWDGRAALENEVMQAARWSPPPYVPTLRDLPKDSTPRTTLAAKGSPVLPKRATHKTAPPVSPDLHLSPVLYPLSGIAPAAMPGGLPPFTGAVDEKVTAEPWRFLLRLNSDGQVQDCVSLAGGDDAGPAPLQDWLRGVIFQADPAKPSRWISVGVGFTNQSAHGPDAR